MGINLLSLSLHLLEFAERDSWINTLSVYYLCGLHFLCYIGDIVLVLGINNGIIYLPFNTQK